jgi:hypothetical protein
MRYGELQLSWLMRKQLSQLMRYGELQLSWLMRKQLSQLMRYGELQLSWLMPYGELQAAQLAYVACVAHKRSVSLYAMASCIS